MKTSELEDIVENFTKKSRATIYPHLAINMVYGVWGFLVNDELMPFSFVAFPLLILGEKNFFSIEPPED